MSFPLRCLLLFSLLCACQSTPNGKVKDTASGAQPVFKSTQPKDTELAETYKESLDLAIDRLTKAPTEIGTKTLITKLFTVGREIAQIVKSTRPECEAYLKELLALENRLLTLSADAIEAGYHRDGQLPKTAQPLCHHAKDLVVHPATVLILMKQSPPAKSELMLRELVELTGHLAEVAAELAKK